MDWGPDRVPWLRPGAVFLARPVKFVADCLSGQVHCLNDTGFEVLAELGQGLTAAEIAKKTALRYGQRYEQAVDDVLLFLNHLSDLGIVKWGDLQAVADQYWEPVRKRVMEQYGMEYRPGLVYWEFTNDCNLRCHMCYNESGLPSAKEATPDERRQRLHELTSSRLTKPFRVCRGPRMPARLAGSGT